MRGGHIHADQEKPMELMVDMQLGLNNALQPNSLPKGNYLVRRNAYQNKIGSNAKRPGSAPITSAALATTIQYLTEYRFNNSISPGAAPTLSAVGNAGSTLPAGTYYVRRTYVTDNGETASSAESSVVVPPPVANPAALPTLATATTGGSLAPGTYYFVNTWINSVGETQVSPEASIVVPAGTSTNTITATIAALPAGATSAGAYLSTSPGTETKQGSTATTTYTQTAALVTGAAKPTSNTCIAANLQIVSPAIPFHVNSINLYISTSSNAESKQVNTTSTTYIQSTPLVAGIAYPTVNTTAFSTELLAASGTTLYAYYNGALNAANMTNPLVSSNIYTVAFTDVNLASILFITDGGAVKKYDGTSVLLIPPAPDDASPAPANGLASINALNPVYCWSYTGHMFVSNGKDVAYFSKRFVQDYFPVTYFQRWVRNNDYMTGPGIAYGNVCLIPMRKGWAVLTGSTFNDFNGNQFLNTINGNVSPRAIQKVTYPDGTQTIVYLSDDGVYEIYDTGFIDSTGAGSRNFSTRSLMKNKIDFVSYSFTSAEMTAAEAYFDSILNLYIMTIKRAAVNYAFVYDVRTKEWDLWDNIRAESTIRFNGTLYYAGSTKFIHAYDATISTDYDDFSRTSGTIVVWDCYTDVIAFEDSGYQSYLDYILVNSKNFATGSTIEVTVVGTSNTTVIANAVQSQYAVWDVSLWDFCIIANTDFTNIVGPPPRIKYKKKSYYFQIRFRNIKNELVEMYKYKLIGRTSGG